VPPADGMVASAGTAQLAPRPTVPPPVAGASMQGPSFSLAHSS